MRYRDKYHQHEGKDVEPGCLTCREKFENASSVCGFCCQPVTNKTYLSGDYHQTGKCKARLVYKEPKRTVDKPMTSPSDAAALGQVRYWNICNCKGWTNTRGETLHMSDCKRYVPTIETYHDLAVWWDWPSQLKTERSKTVQIKFSRNTWRVRGVRRCLHSVTFGWRKAICIYAFGFECAIIYGKTTRTAY